MSLSSTLSPIFLTQFPQVLSESDTPNWQRASHTNDSIWRPYLLSNKCPCLWSWEPRCNTLNHIKFKFKSPHPTRWLPLPVYTIKFKIPYLCIIYLISMSAEMVLPKNKKISKIQFALTPHLLFVSFLMKTIKQQFFCVLLASGIGKEIT